MKSIKYFEVFGSDKLHYITGSYGRYYNRRDAVDRINECSRVFGVFIKFWIDEKIIYIPEPPKEDEL